MQRRQAAGRLRYRARVALAVAWEGGCGRELAVLSCRMGDGGDVRSALVPADSRLMHRLRAHAFSSRDFWRCGVGRG